MKITFAKTALPKTGVLVVGVLAKKKLSQSATKVDKHLGGVVTRAIKVSNFDGNVGQSLKVLVPAGSRLDSVVLVGLGNHKEINTLSIERLGSLIYAQTFRSVGGTVSVVIDPVVDGKISASHLSARIAYGAKLRSYRFDKYKTKLKDSDKPKIKNLIVCSSSPDIARREYRDLEKVAKGVFLTRDLVSEPANVLFPESLAKEAKLLEKDGVKVEVLSETQMRRLGMGALLGVGQGSVKESKMVVMQWKGRSRSRKTLTKTDQPIAFVGKGVTFDTGGISIKPASGMEDMKWDMGGAGVVIGLMKALAGRKAKANVVGVVGLVENMPGGNSQRPGDIVTSMSGQTIEVLNTDAEGRLVLADALWYTKERFKPKFMINLATLTGAIIISLGDKHAGLFSNNDILSERLINAGKEVDELIWRMPLSSYYDKLINSNAADMQNIGGRGAGSITAAQFLQRFVSKTHWAHLDIACVTWSKSSKPTVPKGGTAFGVRLLERLVANHYEN